MRRAARLLLYLGAAGVVLGLGKYHAAYIGHYDFTNSFRFAWSIAYIVMLIVAAYAVGLPDLARGARSAVLAAVAASATAAVGISGVQLGEGSGLLPPFVVFVAAVILVPWDAFCVVLPTRSRTAAEQHARALSVLNLE